MLDAYIITIPGNPLSESAATKCVKSAGDLGCTEIKFNAFEATTPDTLDQHWEACKYTHGVAWTWPLYPISNCMDNETGLYKSAYTAVDQRKKMACSLSHIRLWEKCKEENKPILILEHDALFTREFSYDMVRKYQWGALGINDPRGATRKSKDFYQCVVRNEVAGVYDVPKVNSIFDAPYPQGLAGNSAYLLRPVAADSLLQLVKKHGIWPNDAIMCQELCPWLRVTYPFYTTVQRTVSTTVN